MKNLIKKITRPFFDFSNPGHRIKKVVHFAYKFLVAIAAGLGAIPGAIFGGALGVYLAGAVGALVMTVGGISQMGAYISTGTVIGILIGILVVPLCVVLGLLITGFILGFITMISLWFPYILIYAFGELVENSGQVSQSNVEIETKEKDNNKRHEKKISKKTKESEPKLVLSEILNDVSKKEKGEWICSCGARNSNASSSCYVCFKSRY